MAGYSYAGLQVRVTADTREMARSISRDATRAGQNAARGIGQEVTKGVSGLRGVLGAVGNAAAVGLAGATVAAGSFAVQAFRTAARAGEMDATLRALATANNLSYDAMQQSVSAIRGQGIEAGVAQNLVAQFARNQLDLGKSTDLARVAQDAAVISGQNSSETLDQLIHGITTQNSLVLRNAGVNVQAGQAMDEYAASLGKSRTELTPTERAQAVLNAVLEAGTSIAGAYSAAMEEPGKVLRSYPRLFDDIRLSIGQGLVQGFGPLIIKGYELTKVFSHALQPGGKLAPVMDAIGVVAGKIAAPLGRVIDKVTEWLRNLDPAKVQRFADVLKQWGPLLAIAAVGLTAIVAPQILGNLPFMGNAVSNIGLAFTKSLIPGVGGANNAMSGLMSGGVLPLVAGFALLMMASPELRSALGEVGRELMTVLGGALRDILAALRPLLPQFLELARTLGGLLAEAIRAILPHLVQFVETVLVAMIPMLPLIAELTVRLAEAFLQILAALLPLLPIALEFAVNVLQLMLPVLPVIATAVAWLAEGFLMLVGPLVQVTQWAMGFVGQLSFLQPLISGITGILPALTAAILFGVLAWQSYRLAMAGINWIQNAFEIAQITGYVVLDTAAKWANSAATWAVNAAQWAWNAAKTAGSAVAGFFTGVLTAENIAKWANSAATWASSAAQWAWTAAKQAGTAVIAFMTGLLSGETIAKAASTVATWAQTVAQWALNSAFWACPLTWIVAGILVLVGVIILIATKTDWFQRLWAWAWAGIQRAAEWCAQRIAAAWNWLQQQWNQIWHALLRFWNWFWDQTIGRVLRTVHAIGQAIASGWNWVRQTWHAVWNGIGGWFSGWWERIKQTAHNAVNWVAGRLQSAWGHIRSTARTAWEGVVGVIRAAWEGVKKAVGTPVFFVASKILRPLLNGINKVLKVIPGIPEVPTGWIDSIPHFHRGGRVPGGWGGGDKQPILAEPGEWVLTKHQARAIGYSRLASLPRYRDGGLVGQNPLAPRMPGLIERVARKVAGGMEWLWDGFKKVKNLDGLFSLGKELWDDVTGFLRMGTAEMLRELSAPLRKLVEPFKDDPNVMKKFMHGVVNQVLDSIITFIAGKEGMGAGGIVPLAMSFDGHRYVWGGPANPEQGWDCSSFINFLAGTIGLPLPGGFKAPSSQHGPITTDWLSFGGMRTIGHGAMDAGDIAVNPQHIILVTGKGGQGFAARSTATGTGPQRVTGAYTIRRWPGMTPEIAMGGGAGGATEIPGGDAIRRWAPLVTQVANMLGIPHTVNAWLSQIKSESGGNPNAMQRVMDVNMRNGNPARGLLQVIPQTFAAYAGPMMGRGIMDPLANIYAAMNYAKSRYGARMLSVIGHGHGYAQGGIIREPVVGWGVRSGERYEIAEHGPELVSPLRGKAPGVRTSGPDTVINVYPQRGQDERQIAAAVSRELAWAQAGGAR